MERNNSLREILTKDYLEDAIKQGISARQLGKQFNVSGVLIRKIAKENNITFPKVNYNNRTYKRWRLNDKGYIVISIGNDTYELEHRIVVQNCILRAVSDKESIHHINGDRTNNKPCNLVLLDKRLHDAFHTYCRDNNLNYVDCSVYHVLCILNYKIRVEMYAELIRIYEV